VAVRQTSSLTESVEMWRISTRAFVTRDQFTTLPMPDEVMRSGSQSYSRKKPKAEVPRLETDDSDDEDE
jgi:hypothetical protein